jgi:hypothetical protein
VFNKARKTVYTRARGRFAADVTDLPPQALSAGDSVEILLRIYAHLIDGEVHLHRRKIEAAEQLPQGDPTDPEQR